MTHNEVEVLEREEPSGHPGIGVLSAGHPLKRCVVSDQGELPAKEIVAQLQDCPFDGQGLLFYRRLVFLGRGQLPANINDRMLLTFLDLGQDGSQSRVGGIFLQLKSGARRTGAEVRAPFTLLKASSAAGVHCIFSGCPFLVRSVKEAAKKGEVRDEAAIVPR